MDENDKLAQAKRQVQALTGFYVHLTVFVLVMALLLFINVTASDVWWVQWPLFGWGIAVLVHAVFTFGQVSRRIGDWQARKVDELKDSM